MSYNPNIPQAADFISQSQQALLTNFGVLDTAFTVNHTALPLAPSQGKHKFVSMYEQAADPVTAANEIAIYTKDAGGVIGTREYLRQEGNGAVFQISGPTPLAAVNGYTYLPGGLIYQWGVGTASPAGFANLLPLAFPTTFFAVVITVRTAPGDYSTGALITGLNSFTACCNGSPQNCYFFAMGN